MSSYFFREATIDDLSFLKTMLYEAVFWNPKEKRISFNELFAVPEIANILGQWKVRDGDFGLIAQNEQ